MDVAYPGCQLAEDFDDRGWPEGVAELLVEPKLDGYRLSAVVGHGAVTFHCRDAESVPWGANLGHIAEALLAAGFRNCMVDGEVMAATWNATGVIRRKSLDEEQARLVRETVKFHVFDWVCLELGSVVSAKLPGRRRVARPVFEMSLAQRLAELRSRVAPDHPVLVLNEGRVVRSEQELRAEMDVLVARGFEGAMAKVLEAPYVMDRFEGWLKVKPVRTFDAVVEGAVEGAGKYVGMLGALACRTDDGVAVSVGTGFLDEDRRDFWARRDELVGKRLEIKAQVSDVATARHPVFVRWRDEKEAAK